ncbi:lon protease -like protein [Tropilaelaps mercedesae]|uniref:Lon protease-like protein n=1 Tax=Tropilaelaps mercedesae TaxID=418985 RepID=A0A1V9X7B6_9ACAR|nr:lon protease -like protein [Tropilaelaps mercedesae]
MSSDIQLWISYELSRTLTSCLSMARLPVKLKVIAAKRSGVTVAILPEANRRDFNDLPDFVRADIETHFVSSYDEVFKIVFSDSNIQ